MAFSLFSKSEDPFTDSNISDNASEDTMYERFTNQMLIPLRLLQEFSKGKAKGSSSKYESLTEESSLERQTASLESQETLMDIVSEEFSNHVKMGFNTICQYGVRKAIAELKKEMEVSLPALPQDLQNKLEVQKILPTHSFTSDYTLILARRHGIKEAVKILQTDILASLEDDYMVEKTINGYNTEYKVTDGSRITYITKRKDEEAIVKVVESKAIEGDSEVEEFATAVEVMSIEESICNLDKLIDDAKKVIAKLGESFKDIAKRLNNHKASIKAEDFNLAEMKKSLSRIETLKGDGKREFEERIKRQERFEASERAFFETMAILEKDVGDPVDEEATLTEAEGFHEQEIWDDCVDVSSTVGLAL